MEHRVNNRAVSIERNRGASHGTYTAHMRQFVGRWGAKMGAPFIVLLVLLAMSKPASAQDPPFRGTVFDLSSNRRCCMDRIRPHMSSPRSPSVSDRLRFRCSELDHAIEDFAGESGLDSLIASVG